MVVTGPEEGGDWLGSTQTFGRCARCECDRFTDEHRLAGDFCRKWVCDVCETDLRVWKRCDYDAHHRNA